jgi:hypothetical protein
MNILFCTASLIFSCAPNVLSPHFRRIFADFEMGLPPPYASPPPSGPLSSARRSLTAGQSQPAARSLAADLHSIGVLHAGLRSVDTSAATVTSPPCSVPGRSRPWPVSTRRPQPRPVTGAAPRILAPPTALAGLRRPPSSMWRWFFCKLYFEFE